LQLGVNQHTTTVYVLYCLIVRQNNIRPYIVGVVEVVNYGSLFVYYILDLQLYMQSVPITTKVVSLNPTNDEVYSIQHYVIKFVSDLRQVGGFLRVLRFPPQKVALNTLTPTLTHIVDLLTKRRTLNKVKLVL
jgi:hypothetical protein